MLDFALNVLALVAGGFALQLYSSARPPLGYQEDHGFPPGAQAKHYARDCPSEKLS